MNTLQLRSSRSSLEIRNPELAICGECGSLIIAAWRAIGYGADAKGRVTELTIQPLCMGCMELECAADRVSTGGQSSPLPTGLNGQAQIPGRPPQFWRGLAWAVVLSLPVWALIGWLIWAT